MVDVIARPEIKTPEKDLVCSFNPIFRLSRQAVRFIVSAHEEGWRGHHEVLLGTLLSKQFAIRDFGGVGEFVHPGDDQRAYIDAISAGRLAGTVRYHNPHGWTFTLPRNKLVHPVKPGRVARRLKRLAAGLWRYVKSD